MARVYISSTYEDLKRERKKAYTAIRRAGHDTGGMEKYGAKPIRVLHVCEDDVRRCDLFVGLIGWRLGSKPEGKERSFTRHEFDWAEEYEIPRLLYIAPDREKWIAKGRAADDDDTEIRTFRNSIQEMAYQFTSLTDLEKQIGIDVAEHAPRSKARSWTYKFLPYFCDRTDQRLALINALKTAVTTGWDRPWLVVVDGDVEQKPRAFVKCVKRRHLPAGLELRTVDASVKKVQVPWPKSASREGFEATFWSELASALTLGLQATKEDTIKKMLGLRRPLMVHLSLPFSDWSGDDATKLDHLRNIVRALEHEKRPYPVLFVAIASLLSNPAERVAAVRGALETFAKKTEADEGVLALAALPNVTYDNVVEWADSDEVAPLFPDVDLMDSLDDLMDDGELTMKAFVKEAVPILEKHLPKEEVE